MKFKIGDTVKWEAIGITGEFRVIDVFEFEPKMLLLTEIQEGSGKCNTALQCDCTLVKRDEAYEPKKYAREIKKIEKRIAYIECSEESC